MAARVLVFEPRARVLGRVSEMLRRTGTETLNCYSEAKFRHSVKTCGDSDPLIVCPDRFVAVAREVSPGGKVIPYRTDLSFDEADAGESRRLMHEVSRVARQRGRRDSRRPLNLLVVGASTGGFPIVQEILSGIAPRQTIVVIAQHISSGMTADLSRVAVKGISVVPVDGRTRLRPGGVYLLAGGKDYEFVTQGSSSLLLKTSAERTSYYHPSITTLLRSLAAIDTVGKSAAIILSGLGSDGASSLPALQKAGVMTLAQDPSTAKAPGMPTAAVASGAVSHVYSVDQLHDFIQRRVK